MIPGIYHLCFNVCHSITVSQLRKCNTVWSGRDSSSVLYSALWDGYPHLLFFFCQFIVEESVSCQVFLRSGQRRLVGGGTRGRAHCNGWKGVNGTISNIWLFTINSIPAITMSPSSYSSSHQPPLLVVYSTLPYLCRGVNISLSLYYPLCLVCLVSNQGGQHDWKVNQAPYLK